MKNLVNKGCLLLLLILDKGLFAQTFHPIKQVNHDKVALTKKLVIGDKMPNVYLEHITNYSLKKAKLYDLKAKLTILDFWSSSCSSCIELFPHLQRLRDQFKNQLQIILVNGKSKLVNDDQGKIKFILSKLEKRTGTKIKLPVVYNCKVLDDYFPYVKIPEEVWINDKGIIVGITGAAEVNSTNLESILKGRPTNMHFKNDTHIDLGKQTLNELLYGNDKIANVPLFTSTLLKGMIDGLNGTGIRSDEKGNIYGFYVVNQSLLSLFRFAYRNLINVPNNQIFFENTDTTLFKKRNFLDPNSLTQLYSYDLNTSPGKINDLIQYMQSDLEKFFHLSVKSEKRELICYIIKAPVDSNRLMTSGKETDWVNKNNYINIINSRTDEVLTELNRLSSVPFIDETGMTKNIDMKLPEKLEDTAGIIKALTETGFEVKKENRLMEIVVIKDRN